MQGQSETEKSSVNPNEMPHFTSKTARVLSELLADDPENAVNDIVQAVGPDKVEQFPARVNETVYTYLMAPVSTEDMEVQSVSPGTEEIQLDMELVKTETDRWNAILSEMSMSFMGMSIDKWGQTETTTKYITESEIVTLEYCEEAAYVVDRENVIFNVKLVLVNLLTDRSRCGKSYQIIEHIDLPYFDHAVVLETAVDGSTGKEDDSMLKEAVAEAITEADAFFQERKVQVIAGMTPREDAQALAEGALKNHGRHLQLPDSNFQNIEANAAEEIAREMRIGRQDLLSGMEREISREDKESDLTPVARDRRIKNLEIVRTHFLRETRLTAESFGADRQAIEAEIEQLMQGIQKKFLRHLSGDAESLALTSEGHVEPYAELSLEEHLHALIDNAEKLAVWIQVSEVQEKKELGSTIGKWKHTIVRMWFYKQHGNIPASVRKAGMKLRLMLTKCQALCMATTEITKDVKNDQTNYEAEQGLKTVEGGVTSDTTEAKKVRKAAAISTRKLERHQRMSRDFEGAENFDGFHSYPKLWKDWVAGFVPTPPFCVAKIERFVPKTVVVIQGDDSDKSETSKEDSESRPLPAAPPPWDNDHVFGQEPNTVAQKLRTLRTEFENQFLRVEAMSFIIDIAKDLDQKEGDVNQVKGYYKRIAIAQVGHLKASIQKIGEELDKQSITAPKKLAMSNEEEERQGEILSLMKKVARHQIHIHILKKEKEIRFPADGTVTNADAAAGAWIETLEKLEWKTLTDDVLSLQDEELRERSQEEMEAFVEQEGRRMVYKKKGELRRQNKLGWNLEEKNTNSKESHFLDLIIDDNWLKAELLKREILAIRGTRAAEKNIQRAMEGADAELALISQEKISVDPLKVLKVALDENRILSALHLLSWRSLYFEKSVRDIPEDDVKEIVGDIEDLMSDMELSVYSPSARGLGMLSMYMYNPAENQFFSLGSASALRQLSTGEQILTLLDGQKEFRAGQIDMKRREDIQMNSVVEGSSPESKRQTMEIVNAMFNEQRQSFRTKTRKRKEVINQSIVNAKTAFQLAAREPFSLVKWESKNVFERTLPGRNFQYVKEQVKRVKGELAILQCAHVHTLSTSTDSAGATSSWDLHGYKDFECYFFFENGAESLES